MEQRSIWLYSPIFVIHFRLIFISQIFELNHYFWCSNFNMLRNEMRFRQFFQILIIILTLLRKFGNSKFQFNSQKSKHLPAVTISQMVKSIYDDASWVFWLIATRIFTIKLQFMFLESVRERCKVHSFYEWFRCAD